MRKNSIIFICCAFLFILSNLYSITISVSEINVYTSNENITNQITKEESNFSQKFIAKLNNIDTEAILSLKLLDNNGKKVSSKLEASEICEILNLEYLLFGSLEKTKEYYSLEMKLYDNETKSIKKTFYVKSEIDNFDSVVVEASQKFFNYMSNILGGGKILEDKKRSFGGFGIFNGAGYSFLSSNWNKILTPLFCVESGLNLIPYNYLFKKKNLNFYFQTGLHVQYLLAVNKEGLLKAYFNSILFKIPLEAVLEIYSNNRFIFGINPQMQLDIFYQERLFDNSLTNTSLAFSLCFNVGYEYWFTKNKIIAIGISNLFDVTFYNNLYSDYRILLYNVIRIPVTKTK